MAAKRGRKMLIYIGAVADGVQLGGLRTTNFSMNNGLTDVSTKDTDGWRELLEDGSLKAITISGDGIFKDSTSDETIRGYVFANSINPFGLKFDNGDVIEGDFQVTAYQRSGGYEGAETYSITLESSGIPTFTPGA